MRSCAHLSSIHSWASCNWVCDSWCDFRCLRVRSLTAELDCKPLLTQDSMIIQTTPLRKRSTYAGIGGATEALASLSAPLIGGLLTDQLTWRWCFFIELPLTAVAFIMVKFFFDMSRRDDSAPNTLAAKIRYLDLLGTALFVPSLASLMLALQWGGSKYGWSNWRILTALGVFLLLAAAFAYLQRRRQERATLPPRIILQRSVIFGFWFSCCNNAALSIIEYYVRHLQQKLLLIKLTCRRCLFTSKR